MISRLLTYLKDLGGGAYKYTFIALISTLNLQVLFA